MLKVAHLVNEDISIWTQDPGPPTLIPFFLLHHLLILRWNPEPGEEGGAPGRATPRPGIYV